MRKNATRDAERNDRRLHTYTRENARRQKERAERSEKNRKNKQRALARCTQEREKRRAQRGEIERRVYGRERRRRRAAQKKRKTKFRFCECKQDTLSLARSLWPGWECKFLMSAACFMQIARC